MAYKTKFLNYATQARFDTDLGGGLIDSRSVVFIQDTKRVWTHNNFFDTLWPYVGGKPTTLAGYGITDAYTKFEVDSNITGAINNLQIGGRNLLRNTLSVADATYPSSGYVNMASMVSTIPLIEDEYVLSFEAKSTVSGDRINCYFYNPNTTTRGESSLGGITTSPDGDISLVITNEWKKYWIKYTQSATTTVKYVIVGRLAAGAGSGVVSIRNIQLEKGNKATDWTPAPEDVQAAINLKADINSPSFTGIPLAPTALIDNNSNQIATTAFVKAQNYLTGITKAQVEAVLTGNISSHTHSYLPLTGGTITGSVYNMLELKRSDANGSSILFSNSSGNLGKLGFTSDGVFHLGTGTSTDGQGNLLRIASNGAATFYNTVTAPSFIGSLSGNAGSATQLQTARLINGTSFNGTANITTANWGTARTLTIGNTGKSVNGSGNVAWSLAEIGAQSILTNPITGTGTTNYLSKFTASGTIGNSIVYDNGTNVGIGTTSPSAKLDVNGTGRFTDSVTAPTFIGNLSGSADMLDGYHVNQLLYVDPSGSILSDNTNRTMSGFGYASNGFPTNGSFISFGGLAIDGHYVGQLQTCYYDSRLLFLRTRNDDAGIWNGWNRIGLYAYRDNWNSLGVWDSVSGQLSWNNYGNNHTIFDASNSTSPSGTSINNTNSAIAWSPTYPTLMGWNGSETYGVRVDSARLADNVADSSITYSKLGLDLKQKAIVTSSVNLSTAGIGEISLTEDTAFTFTGFQLNKSYLLKIVTNNYTYSFSDRTKHVFVGGNVTIEMYDEYYINLTCIDATPGSEVLLTTIMKKEYFCKYQTAVAAGGYIYISNDYGNTWTQKGSSQYWYGVAIDSTGKYQTAVADGDYIYISSDYGNTWTQKGSSRSWCGVAMDSTGKYQTAVASIGYIYISSDYGNTWTQKGSSQYWRGVAMDSTGKYQTAVINGGYIYISNDYGNTWTQKGSSLSWYGVAIDSTGKYQTAVANYIYISNDYGNTWTEKGSSLSWCGVAINNAL